MLYGINQYSKNNTTCDTLKMGKLTLSRYLIKDFSLGLSVIIVLEKVTKFLYRFVVLKLLSKELS
jgi:hypothetical protein